jgi:hypothetical protein
MEIKGNINAGYGNIISGTTIKSSILGGENNNMSTSPGQPQVIHSSIIGGLNNGVYRKFSVILNGYNNNVSTADPQLVHEQKNTILNGNGNFIGNGQDDLIGGGVNNSIDGIFFGRSGQQPNNFNTIINGSDNTIDFSIYSVIGGGSFNSVQYYTGWSNINGGYTNVINGGYSQVIGGGGDNFISGGSYNVIGGGENNRLGSDPNNSFIGGGNNNVITGSSQSYNNIVGGQSNNISDSSRSFIGGGTSNNIDKLNIGEISSVGNIIGGGFDNHIYNGGYSTIVNYINGGGYNHSFIGGGNKNEINGYSPYASIVGGSGNTIDEYSWNTSIVGGLGNQINYGSYSSILGGQFNVVGPYSYTTSIIGGINNLISSYASYSSILGGQSNTVNHQNAHIIGSSNITSVSANTTHVERLNIGTIGSGTPQINLGVDAIGNVVTGTTGAFKYIVEFNTNQDGSVETIPLSAITAAGGIPVGYIEGGGASAKCDFNIECWTQINEPGPSGEWFKGDSSSLLSITVNESTGLITITTTGGALDIILRVVITG